MLRSYVGVNHHNGVPIPDATFGANAVLRSAPWNFSRDELLFYSTGFSSCTKTGEFPIE